MRHMRRTARAEAHITIQQQTTVVSPKQSTGISRKLRSNQVRLIPRIPKFCTSDDGVDAGTVGTCWRANVHEEYGKHATPHPLKVRVTQATRLQWGGYPPKNMLNRNLTSYTYIKSKGVLVSKTSLPWTPDAAMNEPRSATRWPVGETNLFQRAAEKRGSTSFSLWIQHIP